MNGFWKFWFNWIAGFCFDSTQLPIACKIGFEVELGMNPGHELDPVRWRTYVVLDSVDLALGHSFDPIELGYGLVWSTSWPKNTILSPVK